MGFELGPWLTVPMASGYVVTRLGAFVAAPATPKAPRTQLQAGGECDASATVAAEHRAKPCKAVFSLRCLMPVIPDPKRYHKIPCSSPFLAFLMTFIMQDPIRAVTLPLCRLLQARGGGEYDISGSLRL